MVSELPIIRPIADQDIASLAHLMTELGYPATQEATRAQAALVAAHPDYQTWVAAHDDQVIGMIGLIKMMYFEKPGRYIRIAALVVSEAHRNKGIGKALIQKSYAWATEVSASHVVLNSGNGEARRGAHAFYQHLGFEPTTTGFVRAVP